MERTITNSAKEKLDYEFHGDPTDTSLIVLIGHGLSGNKDRPWAVALAEAIAEAGYGSLRFSFSGNGDSEGDFKKSNISKEIKDLKAFVDAAEENGYHKICYVGHSMGAPVGILSALKDERIEMLVSLNGMVDAKRFCENEFGDQTPGKGFIWDDKSLPLTQEFVDDLTKVGSILKKTEKIEVPFLVVHGDKDEIVPVEEGQKLFQNIYEPKHYVELEGCDHVFSDNSQDDMCKAVVEWLQDQPL